MKITKEEIEQFKKDCKARNLKLPNHCTDEWCIKGIEELEKIEYKESEGQNGNRGLLRRLF